MPAYHTAANLPRNTVVSLFPILQGWHPHRHRNRHRIPQNLSVFLSTLAEDRPTS